MTATIKYLPPAAGAFDPTDIVITDNTSGAFLIKDDAGSPHEYMRIDTTNSAEKINFKVPAGNGQINLYTDKSYGYTANGGGQWYGYGGANNWFFGNSGTASPGYLRGFSTDFSMTATSSGGVNLQQVMRARGAGTGDKFKVKSATETNFEIDQDSNATFTLDYGTGSTFKVVDDNASPRTFISITEGSNTRCLIPTFSFNEIKDASAGRVMQLTTSNGIAVERTPLNHIGSGSLTYDQSNDGTAIDIGKTPSFTVVYSSAASAAATSGITLQVTATDFQDGCVAPQYLVLQNQNATHSAKFILDPIGDFAAKETATTGTDAADLIGSGFTLAAGKMAVFTLLACRVRDTGGHYFYCVSLHTKT